MNVTWRQGATAVLLVAAIATGWSAWTQRGDIREETAPVQRSDYTLHDFELVSLGKDGSEAFTLRAPKLARNPGDETMDLETPVFLLPDADGGYWNVKSKTGWVSAANDEVRLLGDVRADSAEGASRPLQVRTERLNLFPEKNEATAAGQVTVNQGSSTMTGQGMTVDLATKRIQMASKVRTRYVPTAR